MPRRYFIGTATTAYRPESGFQERGELAGEVDRMADLFTKLGYQVVPDLGLNPTRDAFHQTLRRFLVDPDRRDSDIVVVYYTGHGTVPDGRHLLLPMADTTHDVPGTAYWADRLVTELLAGNVAVQRVLYLLDTCHAAAAGEALATGAVEFINRQRGQATGHSVGMVVAARPLEQASASAFPQAFVDAVNHRSSGGYEPELLALDGLVGIINDTTPAWQHAWHFVIGDTVTQFVPNPRHDDQYRGFDLWQQTRRRVQAARAAEQRDHVLPRARGLDTARADDLWLFTGRQQALRDVCTWLNDRSGPATMVVTGDPGSGKSALLSRLFVLADQRLRDRVPGSHSSPPTRCPVSVRWPDSSTPAGSPVTPYSPASPKHAASTRPSPSRVSCSASSATRTTHR